jgi:hypothetical protein
MKPHKLSINSHRTRNLLPAILIGDVRNSPFRQHRWLLQGLLRQQAPTMLDSCCDLVVSLKALLEVGLPVEGAQRALHGLLVETHLGCDGAGSPTATLLLEKLDGGLQDRQVSRRPSVCHARQYARRHDRAASVRHLAHRAVVRAEAVRVVSDLYHAADLIRSYSNNQGAAAEVERIADRVAAAADTTSL